MGDASAPPEVSAPPDDITAANKLRARRPPPLSISPRSSTRVVPVDGENALARSLVRLPTRELLEEQSGAAAATTKGQRKTRFVSAGASSPGPSLRKSTTADLRRLISGPSRKNEWSNNVAVSESSFGLPPLDPVDQPAPTQTARLHGTWWPYVPPTKIVRTKQQDAWEDSVVDVSPLYAQGVRGIGRLHFASDEEQQREPAHFATVRAPTCDADCVVKLLLSYWRIERPSVLLSLTGSAQSLSLEPRLEHFLTEGLESAARSTRAWVITGGMDEGVMGIAGRALKSRNTNVQADVVKWTTPLIGIAPLNKTTNGCILSDAMPDEGAAQSLLPYIKRTRNSSDGAALDANHSHFILVDNPDVAGWGGEIEMRASIETRLSEKLALPIVLIVVQGGAGTFKTVLEAFKHNCPVVLVRESMGCARVMADFITELRSPAHAARRVGEWAEVLRTLIERFCPIEARATAVESKAISMAVLCKELLRVLLPSAATDDDDGDDDEGSSAGPHARKRAAVCALHEDVDQLVHIFSLEERGSNKLELAVLSAVVSSCKVRSDAEARRRVQARRAHKPLMAMGSLEHPPRLPLHTEARRKCPLYKGVRRLEVPDALVPWEVAWASPEGYAPPVYEAEVLLQPESTWADPGLPLGPDVLEEVRRRTTYENGRVVLVDEAAGVPLNPRGRTGLRGRGTLGKWGPNHAADPIVTRLHPQTNQLQMVAIERTDSRNIWALPGGFVDDGEAVSVTVKREFAEEVLNIADAAQQVHPPPRARALV